MWCFRLVDNELLRCMKSSSLVFNPKQQTEHVPHENKWSECLEVSWWSEYMFWQKLKDKAELHYSVADHTVKKIINSYSPVEATFVKSPFLFAQFCKFARKYSGCGYFYKVGRATFSTTLHLERWFGKNRKWIELLPEANIFLCARWCPVRDTNWETY